MAKEYFSETLRVMRLDHDHRIPISTTCYGEYEKALESDPVYFIDEADLVVLVEFFDGQPDELASTTYLLGAPNYHLNIGIYNLSFGSA